jgi:hypothetical protein
MPIYAGLDVSDKATHVCVVDVEGAVLRREMMARDLPTHFRQSRRQISTTRWALNAAFSMRPAGVRGP